MRPLKTYVYLLEITSISETIHSRSCSESSELLTSSAVGFQLSWSEYFLAVRGCQKTEI